MPRKNAPKTRGQLIDDIEGDPSDDRIVTELNFLRDVIRECSKTIGSIDNGMCRVCRIGFRTWLRPGVPGPCSHSECLSHRINKALEIPLDTLTAK